MFVLCSSLLASYSSVAAFDRVRIAIAMGKNERCTVVFTVSSETARVAIAQVSSCEVCNPEGAEFPFECVLDRVMLFSGAHT
jgi:hypothetical protein